MDQTWPTRMYNDAPCFPRTSLAAYEATRYTEQAEKHEAILADLKDKFEPAEKTVQTLQERLSEIVTVYLNRKPYPAGRL